MRYSAVASTTALYTHCGTGSGLLCRRAADAHGEKEDLALILEGENLKENSNESERPHFAQHVGRVLGHVGVAGIEADVGQADLLGVGGSGAVLDYHLRMRRGNKDRGQSS